DPAQHRAHHGFQHRAAMAGAKSLAMHDSHAAPLPRERLRQKPAQFLLRLGDGEAVKVDLPLYAVVATAELPQHARLNAGTVEDELFAARERGVHDLTVKALLEHGEPVGAREARGRTRPPGAARQLTRRLRPPLQGLDVPDRFAEEQGILAS